MSTSRIDPANTTIQSGTTTPRTTEAPKTPFKEVFASGANALLTGAEVAGGAMGGPVVAAAIRQARGTVADATSGGGGGGAPGIAGGGGTATADAGTGSRGSEVADMLAMNRENHSFNLQLLALQEEVQTENRRFTTLSNVVRASHDTAKAAVSNVRS
jgi:hypothetical protein